MKRILMILAVLLLLTGCGAEVPAEETAAPPTEAPEVFTEPTGCYEPGSAVETATGGAVRSYFLPVADSRAMVCVGKDLLVFSGGDVTTLTLLSGENLFIKGQIQVSQYLSPDQPSVQLTEKGISYFCQSTGELVLLDVTLKEIARIAAPDELMGMPVLSSDRSAIYYCTAEGVRVLDLKTGISRMLTQISYPKQTLEGLLLMDTVLQCRMTEENGDELLLFISAQDGAILRQTREEIRVSSDGNRYFASVPEGAMQTLVFGGGTWDGVQMLLPEDVTAKGWFLEGINGVVTAGLDDAGMMQLSCYSLSDGKRKSCLELTESAIPLSVVSAGKQGPVYLLFRNEWENRETIYRWDIEALTVNDGEIYISPRYTLESPDTEGLAACQEYADALGMLYGLEILLYTDATENQPGDYRLEAEYQAPLIRRELEKLSWLLSVYPEGFLSVAAENTGAAVLRVALVRCITSNPESGMVESVAGTHYWIGENPYIALAVGQITEHTLYHELYHGMESKIFADSQVYYEWDDLNPDGFTYDYNYTQWQTRPESQWLTGETRAFIDSYSMTFPNEDRARMMEYAMTEGNALYFESEIMQQKLYQLCLGIRKAFGLMKSEEEFLWEQYLNRSLAYVPK